MMMVTMISEGDAVKKTEDFILNLPHKAQHLLIAEHLKAQDERESDLSSLEGSLEAKVENSLKDEIYLVTKGLLKLDRPTNRRDASYILTLTDFLSEKELEEVMSVLPATALVENDGYGYNPEVFFPANVPHELEERMQRLRKEASQATIRRHPTSTDFLQLEDLLKTNLLSAKDVENLTSPAQRYLFNLIASLFSWHEGLSELARDDVVEQTDRFARDFAGTMMTEIKAMNDYNTDKMFKTEETFRVFELVRKMLEITPETSAKVTNAKLKKLLTVGNYWSGADLRCC